MQTGEHITAVSLNVQADNEAALGTCLIEATILALSQWVKVALTFQDTAYFIDPMKIVDSLTPAFPRQTAGNGDKPVAGRTNNGNGISAPCRKAPGESLIP